MSTAKTNPTVAVAAGAAAGAIAAVVFKQPFWLGLLVGGGAGFGASAIAAAKPNQPLDIFVKLPPTQVPSSTAQVDPQGGFQAQAG